MPLKIPSSKPPLLLNMAAPKGEELAYINDEGSKTLKK